MPVELVNKDPRYSKVHLIDPAPLGYLHLAAEVRAAHRPEPVLRRSRDKQQLFGVLKSQARQLAGLAAVERVTVYDAVVFAPPGGDVKDRPATLPAAWFDVAVLAETSSPEAAREVRAAPAWQALAAALTQKRAECTRSPRGTCAGSAMWTRPAPACSCSIISPDTTLPRPSRCGITSRLV